MRETKRASTWSNFRDKISTKRGDVPQTTMPAEVPVLEDSVALSPSNAEHYPALDLMDNWTDDRPSMSQILDGRSTQEIVDVNRQSGDAVI